VQPVLVFEERGEGGCEFGKIKHFLQVFGGDKEVR
jgi:hypothetical protein